METQREEKVHHPKHYGGDIKLEAIKIIDDWCLGFSGGNALKYILRAPDKGAHIEDLKKACWYLRHAGTIQEGYSEVLPPGLCYQITVEEVVDFWITSRGRSEYLAKAIHHIRHLEWGDAAMQIELEVLTLRERS